MPKAPTSEDINKLKEELALVQRGLKLIKLIDDAEKEKETNDADSSDHETTHPVGLEVKFTNPREHHSLRGKSAEVIGHSPKFVRVRRGKETYRRHSSNLTPRK